MRNLTLLLILSFILSLGCLNLQGQTYFSPSGFGYNSYPFNTNSTNRIQWLYGPGQFTGAPTGFITDIYVYPGTSISTATFSDLTIKIGNTTTTSLTTTWITGLTTCYYMASKTFTSVTSGTWLRITLQNPFFYDPTKYICIEINQSSMVTPSGFSIAQYSVSAGTNYRAYGTISGTTPIGADYTQMYCGIDISNPYHLDAGVYAMNTPSNPVAPGTSSVSVTIKNYGKDTLKNAGLRWSMDGVPQTPPSNWSGALASTTISSPYTLGNYLFTVGTHTLKAWTTSPNGKTDSNHFNDTLVVKINCCYAANGTFVIDKAGLGDFKTFNEAVNWLASCGVSGPVLFRVKPGSYTENVSIPVIYGVSATNTITFESFTHDSTSVDLNYTATTTADNYVVKLNGADYVTFRQMKIRAPGAVYGIAVNITGGSDYCTFANNIIMSTAGATSSNYTCIYSDASFVNNKITIKNNLLSGGYYGVYIYSQTGTKDVNPAILNNYIKDFYYMGVYCYYNEAPIISGNIIENIAASSGTTYGIYVNYAYDTMKIYKNQVNLHSTGANYGIYLYYSQGTSLNYGFLVNNFVSINGASITNNYGIYEYYCTYLNIYYNSVNITTKYTSSMALYAYYGSSINVLNNILCNVGTGYAYYMQSTTFGTSNNNDLFSNGSYIGYWNTNNTTLGSFQTSATPYESKSISANPNFFSITDLHVYTKPIDSAGVVISQVKDDIDGEPRNAVKPDIGADEFRVWDNDGGIAVMVSPVNPCAGVSVPCIVKLRNFGNLVLKTTKVKWSINGIAQKTYVFSGSLVNLKDTSLNLGNFTFLKGSFYTLKFWVDTINGVKDQYSRNDTLKLINFHTALSGTYTIGGLGKDYSAFTYAVTDLINTGVCGPVTFIADSGTYTEHISIPPIPGASSVNTITFKSAKSDSTKVVMAYNAIGSSDNYLVQLNGASYIHFEKISFKSTAASYGYIVDLRNGSNYNVFKSCVLSTTTSSSLAIPVYYYSSGTNNNYNLFDNNFMNGGYYGVYLYGYSTTTPCKGNMFRRNTIVNFSYMGMPVYYQDSVEINMNKLSSSTATYGFYMSYVTNLSLINANQLYMNYNSTMYGYYMGNCTGTALSGIMMSNNMISLYGSGTTNTVYGIYSYYGTYTKFYHNSINIAAGGAGTSYGIYCVGPSSGTGSMVEIQNNIISNTAGGYTLYVDANSANYFYIRKSNFNDLSATGTFIGHWGSADIITLKSWQTLSGQDPKSYSAAPLFISNANLHLKDIASFIVSNPIGILTDVDGDARSTKIPVGGADENVHVPYDAGIHGISSPLKVACDGQVSINATLFNFGTNNLDSVYIDYYFNGVVKRTIKYKGSLTYLSSTPITFGIDTFHAAGGPVRIKISTRLPDGKIDQQQSNDGDSVYVKLFPFPVIKSVKNDSICKGDTASLRVYSDNSKIYIWYDSNVAGNVISHDSMINTPPLTSSKTYYVEAGTGGVPSSLTTTNTGTVQEMGNMFDITATVSDITIDSFSVLNTQGTGIAVIIGVYYKAGTYSGFETKPAAWTFLGVDTVLSQGASKFTDISVGGVKIKKGQTYAFYVTSTDVGDMFYSTTSANTYTDTYISLKTGNSIFYPFDSYSNTPNRSWNGIVYYETGSMCNSARMPVTAFVYPIPNPKLGRDTSVCNGKSINLNAGAGIGFHYDWHYGSGSKTISTNQTIKVDSAGNYRVIVSDNCGFLASDTLKFGIYPLPVTQFTVNNMNQCLNGNYFLFTNTSSIKSGKIDHFIWKLGDGTTKTDTNPSYTYKLAGNYPVKLRAFSDHGCTDSFASSVNVFPQPVVSFVVNNNRECLGKNLFKFTNNTTVGSGSIAGQTWYFGDASTNNSKNPSHSYIIDGLFNIKLVSTTDKGCKDSFQLSATVLPQPVASFVIDDSSQCFKTNAFNFYNHSSLNKGTMSYSWDLGDGTKLTTLNGTHSYTKTGSYSVQLITVSDSGCTDTIEHFVYVNPNPTVNLGKDTILKSFQSITLDAGSGMDNYLWSNLATTRTLKIDTTGIGLNSKLFWVTVTNKGCKGSDTIKITFVKGVGIMQLSGNLNFKLYPNPAHSVFYFEATGLEGKADLIITDLQGKEKAILHLIPVNGTVQKQINISEFANGVYILKINNGSELTIGRVIKN